MIVFQEQANFGAWVWISLVWVFSNISILNEVNSDVHVEFLAANCNGHTLDFLRVGSNQILLIACQKVLVFRVVGQQFFQTEYPDVEYDYKIQKWILL